MLASDALAGAHRIGFLMAVALVMGNMIGSGIFLLPSALAAYGGIGLIGWIVSAIGSILLALVFARMSRTHPSAGGPYAFTRLGFGDLAGFLVAWGYWVSVCCGNAAIALAFVGYLEPFIPGAVHRPAVAAAMAAGAVWVLTIVNVRGIREAGVVQVVTTALKILPLLLVGAAAFATFNPAAFAVRIHGPHAIATSVSTAAAMTFWAFGGLESATIPAGSIDQPTQTIPRATIIGTILTALIYIVSTVGVMSVVPIELLQTSTAPFADAARALAGPWAAGAVAAGAAVACFGALNGWILISGQVPLAIATDNLFPRVFGIVTPRGTPAAGLVISSVFTTALIALNASRGLVELFTFIILLGTLNALVPYVFSSLAAFVVDRHLCKPTAAARVAAGIAGLAFAYSLWMIGGAGADVVYWGFLLLLSGLPVYVWVVRHGVASRRNVERV
jgi:APA family basic amino acid/polyamine antiporter